MGEGTPGQSGKGETPDSEEEMIMIKSQFNVALDYIFCKYFRFLP